jgi:hypothetical protein
MDLIHKLSRSLNDRKWLDGLEDGWVAGWRVGGELWQGGELVAGVAGWRVGEGWQGGSCGRWRGGELWQVARVALNTKKGR